jgi:hypothetical protein
MSGAAGWPSPADVDLGSRQSPARPRVAQSQMRRLRAPCSDERPPDVPQARVDRATAGDMQMVIHGLHGIFWALDMLVLQEAADEIASEADRRNGIANLIVAGQQLAEQIKGRF